METEALSDFPEEVSFLEGDMADGETGPADQSGNHAEAWFFAVGASRISVDQSRRSGSGKEKRPVGT